MSEPVLIFDLDGTLIDSAPDISASVNQVMEENGLAAFTPAEVRGFIGNGVQVLLSLCLAARGVPTSGAGFERIFARYLEIYEQAHALTTIYPNVEKVLAALENPLAICTNKPEVATHLVLRHFNLARHFPVVIGGDTLAQRKPDPAPLREAINRMGNRPALFIGDSEIDAETARAAQVPFLLFTEGYRKTPADQLGAVAIFSDWNELPNRIASLSLAL